MKRLLVGLLSILLAPGVAAQEWNSDRVLELVTSAAIVRGAFLGDGGLSDYRASARGFVFFQAQAGERLNDPPYSIKVDQLELEVLWKSPNLSKQRIVGWRDRVDLPTEIRYHRDHLGIVQNNFGDSIRFGDGTEVRNVIHPLSPRAPESYDYRIVDSVAVVAPDRAPVQVYQVSVRPKDPSTAAVVGSVFLERTSAAVVRFWFSFTPSSYIDSNLEDITVNLDNALLEGRFWLPWRQEVEIRRRSAVLDLPIRTIIRGTWEIGDYDLNVGLPRSQFEGLEIVAAPVAVRDSFPWQRSLREDLAARNATSRTVPMHEVRTRISEMSGRAMNGLPRIQFGFGSLSNLAHYNRVEGLTLGLGWRAASGAGFQLDLAASYGTEDRRPKGRLGLAWRAARFAVVGITLGRALVDVSDYPLGSGLVRSLAAQEFADDFGDYYLRDQATAWVETPLATLSLGVHWITGADAVATPATGAVRPNPSFPDRTYLVGRLGTDVGIGDGDGRLRLTPLLETGFWSGGEYARFSSGFEAGLRSRRLLLGVRGWAGVASPSTPDHRRFYLGGWGTIPGEPFREYAGARSLMLLAEVGTPIKIGDVRVGAARAPLGLDLLAVLRVGAVGGVGNGGAFRSTGGARVAGGVALAPLHGLVRVEMLRNMSAGAWAVTVDFGRALWPIL